MKIKPKAGLIIRDPDSFEILSVDGEEKPQTAYWLNHLKNGDVIIVNENAPRTRRTSAAQEN